MKGLPEQRNVGLVNKNPKATSEHLPLGLRCEPYHEGVALLSTFNNSSLSHISFPSDEPTTVQGTSHRTHRPNPHPDVLSADRR
jgi:hypothetical protein